MAAVVTLRDAVALSGRFPLLAGANLEIDRGEILHLLGSNGAGKSSVLRAIAGLVPITSGTAVVLGHDLRVDRRSVRRDIGLLGHANALYGDLSAIENVRFLLRAARVDARSAEAALARLGVGGRLLTTRVARLSQGQRRRVALAALVARRPALWLLDEPHAGLDAGGRATIDEVIGEAASEGITVVFASHELDLAAQIASRVVEVGGGVITEVSALRPVDPRFPEPQSATGLARPSAPPGVPVAPGAPVAPGEAGRIETVGCDVA